MVSPSGTEGSNPLCSSVESAANCARQGGQYRGEADGQQARLQGHGACQTRYCIFPGAQALMAVKQLKVGSLILIDVFTAKGTFSFSLTPKGYQAGIAKIQAWGYRPFPG